MDSGRCSLYIVTPDANAATLKRLRGIGICMGVSITPVSHISDLPLSVHNSDILLIPEHLLNAEFPAQKWRNVFVICGSQKQVSAANFNTIIFSNRDEQAIDWAQITSAIVKKFMKQPQQHTWYGIQHKIASKISTPSTEFAMWAGSYKNLPAVKIDRIIKTLRSVERHLNTSKSNAFTLNINMEPSVLHISLHMKDSSPVELEKISRLFESADFCKEATIGQQGGLMVNAAFNLGATKVSQIIIRAIKPNDNMGTNFSSREVS